MGAGPTDHEPKTPSTLALLCRLGDGLCALPLDCVVETMRPLAIERVAHAPSFVLGLSVVRGQPIPVIDGARLFGGGQTAAPQRFVTVRVGDRRVALAVDAVLGLRDLALLSLGALPPLLDGADSSAVAAVGALDRQLLMVLGGVRAIPPSAWQSIENADTPA
jgi:purine-binding chemotaxis protein CheW